MSYKTIVVNLAVDANPAPIVTLAAELAQRFDAHLIGLAAADVPPLVATDNGLVYEGEIMQLQRTEIEKRLAELPPVIGASAWPSSKTVRRPRVNWRSPATRRQNLRL